MIFANELNRTPPKTQAARRSNPGTSTHCVAKDAPPCSSCFCFGDAKSDQAGGHLSFACGGRNRVVRGAPFGRLRPWRPGVTDFINEWICWGAGTRECQNLVLGAKTRALLHGVLMSVEYGCSLAVPVLQHRLLLNDKAEVDGITIDQVIDRLLKSIPAL